MFGGFESLRSEFFSSPPSAPWSPLTTPATTCALDDYSCFSRDHSTPRHNPVLLIPPTHVVQPAIRPPPGVIEVSAAPPSTPREDTPSSKVSCRLCSKAVTGAVFMGLDCAYCCEDHRRLAHSKPRFGHLS